MPVLQWTKNLDYVDPTETEPHILVRPHVKPRATWSVRRSPVHELLSEARGEPNPVFRAYEVWGKSDWHNGPLARQFELHDVFVVQLRLVNEKLVAEAKALLNKRAIKWLGLGDESEIVIPLSTEEQDHMMRRLAAVPTRLGSWVAEHLGLIFEAHLVRVKLFKEAAAA